MLHFKFDALGGGAVDVDEAAVFKHAASRQFYHTDGVFLFVFEIGYFSRSVIIKFMLIRKFVAFGFFRFQIWITIDGKHTAVAEIAVQFVYRRRAVGAAVVGFEAGVIVNKIGGAQIWRSMAAEAVMVVITDGRDQQQFVTGTVFILYIERVLFGPVRTGGNIGAAFCNTEFCAEGNFIIGCCLDAVTGLQIPEFIFFIAGFIFKLTVSRGEAVFTVGTFAFISQCGRFWSLLEILLVP